MGLFDRRKKRDYLDEIDDDESGSKEEKEKGIFEGGDEITVEDMIIMDIIDGEW